MNTNVLLIIIIVLLALGLLVQFLQLILIFSFPAQLLNLFLDSTEDLFNPNEATGVDVIDVELSDQSQPTNSKGFGYSKKSKRSKRKWGGRTNKTSTDVYDHMITTNTNSDLEPDMDQSHPDEPDNLVDHSSSDLEAKQEVIKSEQSEQVLEEEIPSAVIQLFEQSKSGKVRQRELLEATGLSKQQLKNNSPQWLRKLKKKGIGWYELL